MATTPDSSDPVDKVFNTFELLEKVLTYVLTDIPHSGSYYRMKHVKALHRLQRVNSTFRDVIVRSKTIRVGIFRDQQQGETIATDSATDAADAPEDPQQTTDEELELTTNPLLRYLEIFLFGLDYCWLTFPEGMPGAGITLGVRARGPIEQRKMSDSASASWRRMLFANKPLGTTLTLEVHSAVVSERRVGLGEGATLGEVADEIIKAVEEMQVEDTRRPSWSSLFRQFD